MIILKVEFEAPKNTSVFDVLMWLKATMDNADEELLPDGVEFIGTYM
jgi:hypothetical protein